MSDLTPAELLAHTYQDARTRTTGAPQARHLDMDALTEALAGWLPPDEAAKIVRERDSLARRCAVRFEEAEKLRAEIAELRVVLGTIREGDDYDPGAMVMLYDQAVAEAERLRLALDSAKDHNDATCSATQLIGQYEAQLAAVQPVIDAARQWSIAVTNSDTYDLTEEEVALADAVDALDGGTMVVAAVRLPFKVRGRVPGSAVRISRDRRAVVVEVELYGGDRYAVELDAAPTRDLARASWAAALAVADSPPEGLKQ